MVSTIGTNGRTPLNKQPHVTEPHNPRLTSVHSPLFPPLNIKKTVLKAWKYIFVHPLIPSGSKFYRLNSILARPTSMSKPIISDICNSCVIANAIVSPNFRLFCSDLIFANHTSEFSYFSPEFNFVNKSQNIKLIE